MIAVSRFFSVLAAKQLAPRLPFNVVGNFLQIIERDAGQPMRMEIAPDQRGKTRLFCATLKVPLPDDIRDCFQGNELTATGVGKSQSEAKQQAKSNAVLELYNQLRGQITRLPSTLINKINEIDLASGTSDNVDELKEDSQFDDYESALNFLTNLYSRIQQSVPVAATINLPVGTGWKASLLGYLPKTITLSGQDECIRAVTAADSQEAAKKSVRVLYANRVYKALASPEPYLPKHLQSDYEKELDELKSKIATASVSFDEEEAKRLTSFLDAYKEAFYAPLNEAKQLMRFALRSSPSPTCFQGPRVPSNAHEELPKYARNDLPIHAYFPQIMKSIQSNDITLITGATGSGKTTQLPQFIFSAEKRKTGSTPHMIMTQPKRIAAIAAATRISQEMGQQLGKDACVGYAVRFETVKPANIHNGSLNVCTSGVLLKRLQNDPNLSGISHVIIDEVHERDVTTDVLLLCLKQLLQTRSGSIKIVFMSATLVANKIADYFSSQGYSVGIPFDIAGTNFPVEVNCLENVYQLNRVPEFNKNVLRISPELEKESSEFIENELIGKVSNDEVDVPYAFIFRLILNICLNEPLGSILVFLPGIEDLNLMRDLLLGQRVCDFQSANPKCKLFLLHAGLGITSEMSNELFVPSTVPKPYRKVILATNVAESSVTVPDGVYVIDSGRHRVLKYEHFKRMSVLCTEWVSKANVKQRKGRAGRCRPGKYYFIGSEERYNSLAPDNPPEISRVNLESTCLTIRKIFPLAPLNATFSQLIDPPMPSNIRDSIQRLQDLQALDENEQLCPLGDVMANFPVDPSYAKVLILGCLFKCLDPVLTIVAATGERLFTMGLSDYDRLTINKWIFWYASESRTNQHPFSDHLALCSIINEYEQLLTETERFNFCISRKLMYPTVRRIVANKRNFFRSLQQAGFIGNTASHSYSDSSLNTNSGNTHLIRTLLLMGVFPNVAFRVGSKKNHFKTKLLTYASIPSASGNSQISGTKYDMLKESVDHDDFLELKGRDYPKFWLFDSVLKTSFRPVLNRITAIAPLSLLLITNTCGGSLNRSYRTFQCPTSEVNIPANNTEQLLFLDDWIQIKTDRHSLLLATGLKDLVTRFIDWKARNIIDKIHDPLDISTEFLAQLSAIFEAVFKFSTDEPQTEK